MLRAKVRATETTDVEATIVALRKRCQRAKLPKRDINNIEQQCRDALFCLVNQGRELRELGSQMHVKREIVGEGYSVEVTFQAGKRRSMLQRFIDALRRVT